MRRRVVLAIELDGDRPDAMALARRLLTFRRSDHVGGRNTKVLDVEIVDDGYGKGPVATSTTGPGQGKRP